MVPDRVGLTPDPISRLIEEMTFGEDRTVLLQCQIFLKITNIK